MLTSIEHVEAIWRESKNLKQRLVKADKLLEEGLADTNPVNKDK